MKDFSFAEEKLQEIIDRVSRELEGVSSVCRVDTSSVLFYLYEEEGLDVKRLYDYVAALKVDIETHIVKYEWNIAYKQFNDDISLLDLMNLAMTTSMDNNITPTGNDVRKIDSDYYKDKRNEFQIKEALKRSISQKDFHVAYQPIVNLKKDNELSLESLVRWKYKDDWIGPGYFVPLIEKMGLIEDMTLIVLDRIIHDWNFWKEEIDNLSYISINLSPELLSKDNSIFLLEEILKNIRQAGIPTGKICFEITENVVLEKNAYDFIKKSNELGFKVAIDDFGTGYSSMSHVASFPFNVLKIDKSFIDQLDVNEKHTEVAKTIIQMADRLGVDVVAEGVETLEQLECLRSMGADAIQGYYFSKPCFLSEWNQSTLLKK